MHKLCLAALLVATSAAHAETCSQTGDPIFEIDALVDKSAQQRITKLYDSGAVTVADTAADGKTANTTGCLAKDKLETVKKDLRAMTWTVRHNKIHCMAISPNFTVYKIGAKTMWTQRVCSADSLDDKSQQLLTEIAKLIASA